MQDGLNKTSTLINIAQENITKNIEKQLKILDVHIQDITDQLDYKTHVDDFNMLKNKMNE